jgi:uncharacterized membrane protein
MPTAAWIGIIAIAAIVIMTLVICMFVLAGRADDQITDFPADHQQNDRAIPTDRFNRERH